jgi:hypothetical protein
LDLPDCGTNQVNEYVDIDATTHKEQANTEAKTVENWTSQVCIVHDVLVDTA